MITVIAGTNREGSNTLKVAKAVAAMHRDLGAEVALVNLAELPAAILSPGAYAEKPEGYEAAFQKPVLEADGVVIVTPEYNGGFPGVLKLFIDMLPFPESFEKRPTAYVGLSAGASGALRPVEQLQMIFGYRNAFNFNRRVFMPGIGDLLDDAGAITDGDLRKRLQDQAKAFQEFVAALRPVSEGGGSNG
ncbi:MAG: NAD(P)H-dependent oxidoreductase [Opitutales bacterium]|nr:NAD(P)H-dependent oxidoreductase [Opitutales bacterium]